MKNKKIVYLAMGADILHEGHINIIKKASKLGKIVIGLLTDKAIANYKRLPVLNYEQRFSIINNLKLVSRVIPQYTPDYRPNLNKLRPDYVVHGDDWKKGALKKTRSQVIKELKKWSGKLVEFKYSKGISSSMIRKKINKLNVYSDSRISNLKRLMDVKDLVRIIETHNSLAGLIAENLKITKNNKIFEFDGMWSSSLTESLIRGKPDNQSVELNTRINALSDLMDCTTKPVLFDGDNGGKIEHLPFTIRSLERQGVSGIAIEDKIGLKKNSLFKDQKSAKQDSTKKFCEKIKTIVNARKSNDFLIVARIESFILKKGLNDALKRAELYSKVGADAILIHSKSENPQEVFSFAKKFKKSAHYRPMVAVPSSYSKTKEEDLIKNGFKVVIYANHLLRSAYPAMMQTAKKILVKQRSSETEKHISSIKEIINLI